MNTAWMWRMAVAVLVVAVGGGCDDGGEEPGADTSDVAEDMAPDIEACPSSGAVLQAAPVLIELGPVEVGQSATRNININSGGTGQLCFGAMPVTVEPTLEGLEVGPLTFGGAPVEALDPGQAGTIELTWTPTVTTQGSSALTVQSANGGSAQLELRYESTGGVDLEAIGTLVLNIDVGYIFDAAQWDASASTERDAHPEGVMRTAGFTGTFEDEPVPALAATSSRVYALHRDTQIFVHQRSFAGDAFSSDLVQPQLELAFPDDALSAGTTTEIDPAAPEAHPVLKVLSIEPNADPQLPDERCLLALGFGELTISAASDTTLPEGGTLALRSGVINLYRADATPAGDLTSSVDEACIVLEPAP